MARKHMEEREKQELVCSLMLDIGYGQLVETGTATGDMPAAASKCGVSVYSIEVVEHLANAAIERFAEDDNVTILHGDSATTLPEVLDKLTSPAMFWLDAHMVVETGVPTPILTELESISNRSCSKDAILVDDIRICGRNGWPSLDELSQRARELFPYHSVEVADDIMRILPEEHK